MKKIFTILICIISISNLFSQENEKLIELGKAYKDFMFRNEPPKGFTEELKKDTPESMKEVSSFIIQTITTDNKLLKPQYLILPSDQTLRFAYIIRNINYNIRKENQIDNNKLVDSLKVKDIPRNEIIDGYYDLLFSAVGNKIQPFDWSKIDFKLKDYNLANDTEKGIFFLRAMDMCGTYIWGYMNVPKPPNTRKAFDLIKKYPKFNGLNYYQFTDLNFPDFEMIISSDRPKESYKSYYINKYYNTLLYNLTCLDKENGKEKDINDLLLGSILKDRNLYKYSKQKDILEEMFKVQKNE